MMVDQYHQNLMLSIKLADVMLIAGSASGTKRKDDTGTLFICLAAKVCFLAGRCGGLTLRRGARFGPNTLTHSRGKETRTGAIYTPKDTVLRKQVSEIFTIVHRIDSLSQTNSYGLNRLRNGSTG